MTVDFIKSFTVVNLLPQKHSDPQKMKIIINTLYYGSIMRLSHGERINLIDRCVAQKDK